VRKLSLQYVVNITVYLATVAHRPHADCEFSLCSLQSFSHCAINLYSLRHSRI